MRRYGQCPHRCCRRPADRAVLRRCGGLRAYWRASGELLARVPAAQLRPCRLPGRALLRFRHLAADPA